MRRITPKQFLVLIVISFTLLTLLVLGIWHWTDNPKLEPLAQIFATVAGLAGFIVSLVSAGK